MTEITPRLYQLQLPIPNNPLGYTNVYLLKGDDGYLLIDTGWNDEEAFQSLKAQLAEIGFGFGDIRQIVVTHIHPDHYGLAGRLKELSLAKISLHYLENDLIEPRYIRVAEYLHQAEEWLRRHGVPAWELPTSQSVALRARRFSAPVSPDITLYGGESIPVGVFDLQVIWTPGHSPGHICLYEPTKKILFSGDHILPVTTPHISLQNQSGVNPLGDFLNSLKIVRQLDVKLVLPAHEHSFTNLPARVDEIIQHHERRNSEILEAIKPVPKTAYQISTEITWMPKLGGVNWQSLAPWDKGLAVSETLAHLEALRIDGKVDKFAADSVIYYQRT